MLEQVPVGTEGHLERILTQSQTSGEESGKPKRSFSITPSRDRLPLDTEVLREPLHAAVPNRFTGTLKEDGEAVRIDFVRRIMIRCDHAANGKGSPPLPLRIRVRPNLGFPSILGYRFPPKLPGAVLAVAHRNRLRQDALVPPAIRTELLEPDKVLRAPCRRCQAPKKRLP